MNAREELNGILNHVAQVKCAYITLGNEVYLKESDLKRCMLRVDYNDREFKEFMDSLDFEYDDGYGGQELFGNVWLQDGTWLRRNEYDGSEWWSHVAQPRIPTRLLMTKYDFLDFFNDERYDELTPDDKVNVFLTSLQGSADITKDLLDQLLCEYSVDGIEIKEVACTDTK
jgi:hypothetical protein